MKEEGEKKKNEGTGYRKYLLVVYLFKFFPLSDTPLHYRGNVEGQMHGDISERFRWICALKAKAGKLAPRHGEDLITTN